MYYDWQEQGKFLTDTLGKYLDVFLVFISISRILWYFFVGRPKPYDCQMQLKASLI